MKNNHRFRISLGITAVFLLCNILISMVIMGIVVSLKALEIDLFNYNPITILIYSEISYVILIIIIILLQINSSSRIMKDVKAGLARISNGDFTKKINTKSKNPTYIEIINEINLVMKELESLTMLKQDFIKNFSHEFKTPIVSIKGFSELICQNDDISKEEIQKYCNIIKEESIRLENLSNTILMLSKLQTDAIVINKEEFYLDEQIVECALQFAADVEKNSLEVNFNMSRFKVFASKELLKELWINLFSNAIKYTKPNGTINIYNYETVNDYIICFKDTGIGISDGAKARIFEEYYQEDIARSNEGIGLGLSICKKICELHKYKIHVDSKKDEGSTFSVFIPKNHNVRY